MSNSVCRSKDELVDYVLGRIAAPQLGAIEEHVEACIDCQSTVVQLAEESDTLVAGLRTPPLAAPYESEAACQVAVARLIAPSQDQPSIAGRIGPYAVLEQLGSGGMGTVFKALHTKLKRTVALKVLPAARWLNQDAVARFEREMEIIGQLDHPTVVRAIDAGESEGVHYLVMEFVDGFDLGRLLERHGPVPVREACEIARQAAHGLQYVHDNNLVHRDIKPSNLMLPSNGNRPEEEVQVKILDLGLALLNDGDAGSRDELTTVGQLMGTVDYMSPEQALDSHEVAATADVYSLGATLFKLLTGHAPFEGTQYNHLLQKLAALTSHRAPAIRDLKPELPSELCELVDGMLARDPAARIQTAGEVATILTPLAQGADLEKLWARGSINTAPTCQPSSAPVAVLPLKPGPAQLRGGRRTLAKPLVAVTLLLSLIVFAVVFRLVTDRGDLIIRAADSAVLTIRGDEQSVRRFQVQQGDQTITIRSGEYAIELQSGDADLVLTKQSISVQRGDNIIVEIQQRQSPDSPIPAWQAADGKPIPDRDSQQTYDGKSYPEWLSVIETERMPERLREAVLAFAAIDASDTELASKSVVAILQTMRRYGSDEFALGDGAKLIRSSIDVLLQLPAEVVLPSLTDEVVGGTTRSRAFICQLLGELLDSRGQTLGTAELDWQLRTKGKPLFHALATLPGSEVPEIRASAFSVVIRYAERSGLALSEIDGLLPRLREALDSSNFDLLNVASGALVVEEPDNAQLVEALVRRISPQNPSGAYDAIVDVGRLGSRGGPAVEKLVLLLQPFARKQEPVSYGGQNVVLPALKALGDIGSPAKDAAPLLRGIVAEIVRRKDPTFADYHALALEALNKIEMPTSINGRTLNQWIVALPDEQDPTEIRLAFRALGEWARTDRDEAIASTALSALRHFSPNQLGVDGEHRRVLDEAAKVLKKLERDALVTALYYGTLNKSHGTQYACCVLVTSLADLIVAEGAINQKHGLVQRISSLAHSDSAPVRAAAAQCIGRLVQDMEMSMTRPVHPVIRLIRLAEDLDTEVALVASAAVADSPQSILLLNRDRQPMLLTLSKLLSHEDPNYRGAALRAIHRMGPHAESAVEALAGAYRKWKESDPGPFAHPGRNRAVTILHGLHVPTVLHEGVGIVEALGATRSIAARPTLESIEATEKAPLKGYAHRALEMIENAD